MYLPPHLPISLCSSDSCCLKCYYSSYYHLSENSEQIFIFSDPMVRKVSFSPCSWGMHSTSMYLSRSLMPTLSCPLESLVAWDHPYVVFYSIKCCSQAGAQVWLNWNWWYQALGPPTFTWFVPGDVSSLESGPAGCEGAALATSWSNVGHLGF